MGDALLVAQTFSAVANGVLPLRRQPGLRPASCTVRTDGPVEVAVPVIDAS